MRAEIACALPAAAAVPVDTVVEVERRDEAEGGTTRAYTSAPAGSCGRVLRVACGKARCGRSAGGERGARVPRKASAVERWTVARTGSCGAGTYWVAVVSGAGCRGGGMEMGTYAAVPVLDPYGALFGVGVQRAGGRRRDGCGGRVREVRAEFECAVGTARRWERGGGDRVARKNDGGSGSHGGERLSSCKVKVGLVSGDGQMLLKVLLSS